MNETVKGFLIIITGGFVLITILLLLDHVVKSDFAEACKQLNGVVTFDGRQYQCLRKG